MIQPIHGEQCAFACAAGGIVINQMPFEIRCQKVITQAVLQDTIPIMQRRSHGRASGIIEGEAGRTLIYIRYFYQIF